MISGQVQTQALAPCALCGSTTADRDFWGSKAPTCASVFLCFARQRREAEKTAPLEPLKPGQYVWRNIDGLQGKVQRVTQTQAEILWPQGDVTLEDRRAVKRIMSEALSATDLAKLNNAWPSWLPR